MPRCDLSMFYYFMISLIAYRTVPRTGLSPIHNFLLFLHIFGFPDDTDADSTYQPPSGDSDSDSEVDPDLPEGNRSLFNKA